MQMFDDIDDHLKPRKTDAKSPVKFFVLLVVKCYISPTTSAASSSSPKPLKLIINDAFHADGLKGTYKILLSF